MPIKVSVEMVMIFEQVEQNQFAIVIVEFVLQFNNWLFALQNKLRQSILHVVNVGEIL